MCPFSAQYKNEILFSTGTATLKLIMYRNKLNKLEGLSLSAIQQLSNIFGQDRSLPKFYLSFTYLPKEPTYLPMFLALSN
jgi:hypothetical protein